MSFMNAIKIFGENYINKNNAYAFLSGSALVSYLYDQKRQTAWLSSGSNNTIEEYIEITFKNWQGEVVQRTFDRVIILGHNIKAGQLQYWDGSAWQDLTGGTITDNTETDNLIEVTSVTTYKFKIKMTTTQIANAEKYIGEIKVCATILEPTDWLTKFKRNDDDRAGDYRLSKGDLVSWREWGKVEGGLDIEQMSLAEITTLKTYIRDNQYLTIVFWDDFDMSETYEFKVTNPINYSLDRKLQYYSTDLDLKER